MIEDNIMHSSLDNVVFCKKCIGSNNRFKLPRKFKFIFKYILKVLWRYSRCKNLTEQICFRAELGSVHK